MEQKERTKRLGTDNEFGLLIKLSVPAVIGLFIQALYNVVDSIFVAHYSTVGLSALTICFPVQMVIISIAVGLEVGGNSLISRLLGRNELIRANEAAEHLLGLIVIFGLLTSVVGFFFSGSLVSIFTDDAQLLAVGESYIRIILINSVFVYAPMVLCGILRAEGNAFIPMVTMVMGGLLNIVLDPWFIFGGWGLSPMGVEGAAWATVLARVISTAFVLVALLKGDNQISIKRFHFAFDYRLILDIFKVGFPVSMVEMLGSVMMAGASRIVGAYGINALAVLGIYFRLHLFVILPIFGIGQGVMPIVGYNFGRKQVHRVKKTIFSGMALGTVICMVGFALFYWFPEWLLLLFGAKGELFSLGIKVLKITSWSFPLVGICIIGGVSFQGFGIGYLAFIESIIRQILVLLPAMWLFSEWYGFEGLWYSFPLSEIASFLVILVFYIFLFPRVLKKVESN